MAGGGDGGRRMGARLASGVHREDMGGIRAHRAVVAVGDGYDRAAQRMELTGQAHGVSAVAAKAEGDQYILVAGVGERGDGRSHSRLDEGDVTERGGEIGGNQSRVPDGLHVAEHPAAAACDHGPGGEFQGAVGVQRVEGAGQVLLLPGEDAAQRGPVTGLALTVGDALVGNGQPAARLTGGAGTQVLGVGEARHGEQLVEILGVRVGGPQELGGAPGQCGGEVRSEYGVQAGGPGTALGSSTLQQAEHRIGRQDRHQNLPPCRELHRCDQGFLP